MIRRLAAVLTLLLLTTITHAANRPNILWLIAEDQGPELSCYGHPVIETPNIDNLARQGVQYLNAFTTAPVCSASRSAFMTGVYQTSIDAQNHRSHRGDGYMLPAPARVLTQRLQDAGYFTANLVKLPEGAGKGTGKTDWNFSIEGKPFQGNDWNDLKSHQPFYAQINFRETHRDYKGPKKADPAKVQIPPYYPDHEITRKDWAEYLDDAMELDRKIGVLLAALEKDGLADNTVVFYFGDHGQAMVRGKQFCYDEGLHIPLLIRWPKQFATPKGFAPGTKSDRLVEAIDFVPTCLEIAGLPKAEGLQGRIMFGDRMEPEKPYAFGARDRCDETVFRFRTARDHQYRYIRNFTPDRPFLQANAYKEKQYPVWNLIKQLHAEGKLNAVQDVLAQPTMPEEELYDIQADPYEIHNLAKDPQHAAVLARMREAVEKWIVDTDDKGRVMESQDVINKQAGVNPQTGKREKGKKGPKSAS
jgi:arylsulfatase A-like enzyme